MQTPALALIVRTETLSKQVVALINLSALLIREISLTRPDPYEHFLRFEAELDGLAEAIAIETHKYSDVPGSSEAIKEVFEQVLRQTRNLLDETTATAR